MTIDDFHKLVREIADELWRWSPENSTLRYPHVPQTRIALLTRLIRANMETYTHPVTTPMTDEEGPISDCHKCEACHQVQTG